MFNGGVPEQLRRFIASPPPHPHPPPLPPPPPQRALPFPLPFPSFEPTHHFLNSVLANDNHKIIHHHHHNHLHHEDDVKDGGGSVWMGPTDHDDDDHHPWSSDEVLSLLRLRSTVENWFPGFTWEHISRKLTEVGFKRTPQECKEKFEEEERRYFNNNNSNDHIDDYNNSSITKGCNFRTFSELEEFYHHHSHDDDDDGDEHVPSEVEHCQKKRQKSSLEEPRSQEKDVTGQEDSREEEEEEDEEETRIKPNEEGKSSSSSSAMVMMMMMDKKKKKMKKKRRRRRTEMEGFEVLKGFCEGLVRNMIAQQEDMHKKILQDMVKRDEEKLAREEAWKKQEMERINKELEIRANEQALASDRNSTIIKFIAKFTSLSEDHHHDHHPQRQHHGNNKVQSPSTSQSSSSLVLPQTPSSNNPTLSSSQTLISQNPLSVNHIDDKPLEPISVQTLETKTHNPKPPKSDANCDLGKRWPRDEVLALVNIRCGISAKNNGDNCHPEDQHHKDGPSSSSKVPPLWERISKKMLELGYRRSAKRCKEKWENINKYFRKTKDVNKKRPLDSRTCPYFHQLSALYSQGSRATTGAGKVDFGGKDPGTQPDETRVGSSINGPGDDPNMHAAATGDDNEKDTVQDSGFDFEF